MSWDRRASNWTLWNISLISLQVHNILSIRKITWFFSQMFDLCCRQNVKLILMKEILNNFFKILDNFINLNVALTERSAQWAIDNWGRREYDEQFQDHDKTHYTGPTISIFFAINCRYRFNWQSQCRSVEQRTFGRTVVQVYKCNERLAISVVCGGCQTWSAGILHGAKCQFWWVIWSILILYHFTWLN